MIVTAVPGGNLYGRLDAKMRLAVFTEKLILYRYATENTANWMIYYKWLGLKTKQ